MHSPMSETNAFTVRIGRRQLDNQSGTRYLAIARDQVPLSSIELHQKTLIELFRKNGKDGFLSNSSSPPSCLIPCQRRPLLLQPSISMAPAAILLQLQNMVSMPVFPYTFKRLSCSSCSAAKAIAASFYFLLLCSHSSLFPSIVKIMPAMLLLDGKVYCGRVTYT
jgi:hypothetical protein